MCTFNLTMNDALVEAVHPTFKTKEAVAAASPVKEHSAWVQSMAKYRRLAPMYDKAAILDSLDERFR